MSEPLLGCPHCAKPVGFAVAMAGQVVACPHCRGQFQMPDRVPVGPPSLPHVARSARPPADDEALSFDGRDNSTGKSAKAELDSYRAAATLANIFALAGAGTLLIVLGLAIHSFVVPYFRGSDERTAQSATGLLWLFASILIAGVAIVGLFLVRACVLMGIDAARTLRALERDSAAQPQSK